MELFIEIDKKEDKLRVEPTGDIDIHNSGKFKEEVLKRFKEDKKDILLDGVKLEYIDSTGLGALIYIYKEIKDEGYKLYLENIKPNILKLLSITELDKIFEVRGESNE